MSQSEHGKIEFTITDSIGTKHKLIMERNEGEKSSIQILGDIEMLKRRLPMYTEIMKAGLSE